MKALQLLMLLLFSVALFTTIAADDSDYTKLCRYFKSGTKVRVPGSCEQYIVCNGDSGEIFTCPSKLKYNAKKGECVSNFDTTVLCDNRCKGKNKVFVSDPTNCRGYYYCENGQAYKSSCEWQYYFNETNNGMCVYPSESACIEGVNSICELVKEGTKFRNVNDCSKYYECKNDKYNVVNCKNQYFDVEEGNCVEKKAVACFAHPIPSCTKTNELVKIADGGSCRGYFVCAPMGPFANDLEPVWFQCPAGTFFDETKKTCLDPMEVKCLHNRCDGRGNMLVNSSSNNCRNYTVCENNMEVEELTCGNDYFFDERLQACVPEIIYFKCCDQPNTHPNVIVE